TRRRRERAVSVASDSAGAATASDAAGALDSLAASNASATALSASASRCSSASRAGRAVGESGVATGRTSAVIDVPAFRNALVVCPAGGHIEMRATPTSSPHRPDLRIGDSPILATVHEQDGAVTLRDTDSTGVR